MSCIRFNTAPQRQAMRDAAASAEALRFLSPEMGDSKIARLRVLAAHERPGIRCSAASNRHAPADLLAALAVDRDPTVRAEVARNAAAAPELVEGLATDPDARVRCWAVLHEALSAATLAALADDRDAQVRRLAGWRLAPQPAQPQPA